MNKKFQHLIIPLFFFISNEFSQAFTVQQTIDYLNEFSLKNPATYTFSESGCENSEYYEFSINAEGFMVIYINRSYSECNGPMKVPEKSRDMYAQFYIEDIDTEKMSFWGGDYWFSLNCIYNSCILTFYRDY